MKIQPYHVPGLDILTHENNCTCADCCNHRAIVSGRRPPPTCPKCKKTLCEWDPETQAYICSRCKIGWDKNLANSTMPSRYMSNSDLKKLLDR